MSRPYAEVIGDPIAHSKSPQIHGFWLNALGIDAEYRAFHVKPDDLATYFAERRADSNWRGCNITIPHKAAALDHAEGQSGVREAIGAINLVLRQPDGALAGINTDAAGFSAPLAARGWKGARVALIGAGGAARAILSALAGLGVERVTVLNRNPQKAAALLDGFGIEGHAMALNTSLPPVDLLVNASPLGMAGQPALDLDLAPLPDHAIVYDIVYAPLETALLRAARARGLETIDGLEMLIGQAASAFALLFGAEPPRERDAELRRLLTR